MHGLASCSPHTPNNEPYVGRFAPSPSGPLHFGSLVCALASYLDARANRGRWLVRIEDIDPPREQPGATAAILRCLERHYLNWDGDIVYQSQRADIYLDVLGQLQERSLSYRCNCTRKRLANLHGQYDGYCASRRIPPLSPAAVRLNVRRGLEAAPELTNPVAFFDRIRGEQSEDLLLAGDYVIHRKDGLFAYQLAVVVDDILQNISHVVRGTDLLDTTARQILLFHLLGKPAPCYAHVSLIVDNKGNKLSKQNRAPAIDDSRPGKNLFAALRALGLDPETELQHEEPATQLQWATGQWQLTKVSRAPYILTPDNNPVD